MSEKLKNEYEKDFYAWALHNAELLRQGKFSEIDVENIAEEIESIGRKEKRELIDLLAVLISNLLRWQIQEMRQNDLWKTDIKGQRLVIRDLLDESPSLRYEIESKLAYAYERSLYIAMKETGLSEKNFPKACPFTFLECLIYDFFPELLFLKTT